MTKTEATKQANKIMAGSHFAIRNPPGSWEGPFSGGDRRYFIGERMIRIVAPYGGLTAPEIRKQLVQAILDLDEYGDFNNEIL